jgi:hypothetical protein
LDRGAAGRGTIPSLALRLLLRPLWLLGLQRFRVLPRVLRFRRLLLLLWTLSWLSWLLRRLRYFLRRDHLSVLPFSSSIAALLVLVARPFSGHLVSLFAVADGSTILLGIGIVSAIPAGHVFPSARPVAIWTGR